MKKLIFLLLMLPFTLFGQFTGEQVQDSINAKIKSPLGATNLKAALTTINQFITQADGYAQGAVPNTRQVIAGAGLVGGGNLTLDRTLSVAYGTTGSTSAIGNDFRINNGQTAYTWGNHAGLYPSVNTQIIAGSGLSGGGDFGANRTLNVTYGAVAGSATEGNDARVLNGQTAYGWGNHSGLYAPVGRLVSAGTGLNGGGSLGADRTLNVIYGTIAGTATEGNDARVSNGQTAYGWGNHSGLYVGKTGDETANGLKTWSNLATFSAGLGHSSHIVPATNLGSNIGSTSNAYANGFFATLHSNGGNLTFRNTNAVGATLFSNGNFRIGSTATDPTFKLQVDGNTNLVGNLDIYGQLNVIGSNNGSPGSRTTGAQKLGLIAGVHYDVSEEPIGGIYPLSTASMNGLYLGGGHASVNAATRIDLYLAANTTTTTGTAQLRAQKGAIMIQDGGTFTSTGEMFQVTGASKLGGNTAVSGTLSVSGATAVTNTLDVYGGSGIPLVLGGDTGNANLRSDATTKRGRIAIPHFTNSEEPMALIYGSASSSSNQVVIGGGSSAMNSATEVDIFAAPDVTTTSGTQQIKVVKGATMIQDGGTFTNTGEMFQVTGTSKLAGNTTLTGKIQNDGSFSANGSFIRSNPVITAGSANGLELTPTVTQSGNNVYRGIWVSPYITSKGLRAELLSLGTNSANGGQGSNTDKFVVYDNGLVYFGGAIKPKNYVPLSNETFTDIAASVLINEEAEEEVIWTLPPVASQEDKVFTILNYANATTTITAAASNSFRNMNSAGSTVSSIVIPAYAVAEVFVKNSRYIVKYH